MENHETILFGNVAKALSSNPIGTSFESHVVGSIMVEFFVVVVLVVVFFNLSV